MQAYEEARFARPGVTPTVVRWGAVFAGGVIGVGFMALASSLWLAFAYESDVTYFVRTLSWWIGGTAIAALFIAGLLAGWLSGIRGPGVGWLDGLTVWGLTVIAVLSVSVPGALRLLNITGFGLTGRTLWAGFWSLLIGAVAAMVGGALGGAMPRRSWARVVAHPPEEAGTGYSEPIENPRVEHPSR